MITGYVVEICLGQGGIMPATTPRQIGKRIFRLLSANGADIQCVIVKPSDPKEKEVTVFSDYQERMMKKGIYFF